MGHFHEKTRPLGLGSPFRDVTPTHVSESTLSNHKLSQLTYESSIQLVFSNFYIGIAWGALDYASAYTNKSTRAWPFGGDVSCL